LFTDNEFLPNQQALGNLEMNIQDVQWIRLQSMIKTDNNSIYKNAVIFDNTIVAEDVCQGALGDCYLLAAFATLCERKVFIQNCFLTTTYNPYGKYRLRFYDLKTKQFVIVTIDDYIPCDKNKKPIFTKFNGHEMWPLLLEKGYAKFKGNYHNIEKGNPLIALKELTGYEGEQFIFGGLKTNHEELFMKLQRYSYYGVLMTSSSKGKDNTKQQQHDSNEEATVVKSSIVPGHAYSILDIKTPTLTTSRIHLLKLRNPWGTLKWSGDWSDDSPLWSQYPGVAFEIGRKHKEDGIFWMCWDDFIKHFNVINVIYPPMDMHNLHFKVVEHDAYCGTCRGCLWGCLKYWFCCKGMRYLCFYKSSEEVMHQLQHSKDSGISFLV